MRALTTCIIFFALCCAFATQANAQASATVSYTIVVTEDMVAGNRAMDGGETVGMQESGRFPDAPEATVSVSVRELGFDGSDAGEPMGYLDAPSNDHPPAGDLQDVMRLDDGDYLVVMEFN